MNNKTNTIFLVLNLKIKLRSSVISLKNKPNTDFLISNSTTTLKSYNKIPLESNSI
jgi:hypothetical protein